MKETIKAELKVLGRALWTMLVAYLTSKKVLTTVLTAVAGAVIKDPLIRDRFVAAGMTLCGSIAIVDVANAIGAKKQAAKEPTLFPPAGAP